jgi:hypothetical protein
LQVLDFACVDNGTITKGRRGTTTVNPSVDTPPEMVLSSGRIDALMANDLNQMSLKERDLLYEQIHGVDERIEETPDFVTECLQMLDLRLSAIAKKPAYNLAFHTSKDYVTDRKFRLMFARAECFDAQKAAMRLARFMDLKLELFGEKALTRPLYLSDLDKESFEFLKSGGIQMLPARDRAGRMILGDYSLLGRIRFPSADIFVSEPKRRLLSIDISLTTRDSLCDLNSGRWCSTLFLQEVSRMRRLKSGGLWASPTSLK